MKLEKQFFEFLDNCIVVPGFLLRKTELTLY